MITKLVKHYAASRGLGLRLLVIVAKYHAALQSIYVLLRSKYRNESTVVVVEALYSPLLIAFISHWKFLRLNSPEFSRRPRFSFSVAVRSRRATASRFSLAFALDCRIPRCSRIRPAWPRLGFYRSCAVSVRA